jgi:hypothetical protein
MNNWTTCALVSLVTASVPAAALAAEGWKVGDRVLALREGTNSYFAATVKSVELEYDTPKGSVTFDDGTVQEYGPITFGPSLRKFEWAVGSTIECGADAKAVVAVGDAESKDLTSGTIVAIDDKSVELKNGDKTAKFPLAACRHRRTWWDELHERWRGYARYQKVKTMPKKGAKQPSGDEIKSAFSFNLETADGGAYIVIHKCYATGKGWTKLSSGEEHTARTIDVVCSIAIPLPPKPKENFACVVEYGTCRQPYQGNGVYGACEWSYSNQEPTQIDCKKAK